MTRLSKLQPVLIALTLINLALLVTLLAQVRATGDGSAILRHHTR